MERGPDIPHGSLVTDALEVEEIDANLFRSCNNLWRPARARGVFGGQVVGQALTAVARTSSEGMSLHSLHSQFLLAGDAERPIVYRVGKLHDGRSFRQRYVTAHQHGRAIFAMLASFQKPEPSEVEHQDAMPAAPEPDGLPTEHQRFERLLRDARLPDRYRPVVQQLADDWRSCPIDIRRCSEQPDPLAPRALPTDQLVWMRAHGRLGDDPSLHTCALAFASDFLLLGTSLRPHGHVGRPVMMASLDHSMWFHHPFRFDDWLLYSIRSSRTSSGRALCSGQVFSTDGRLVASVVQEGVIRIQLHGPKAPPSGDGGGQQLQRQQQRGAATDEEKPAARL